ncbi:MAG: hypothetical protein EB076_08775 [Flavobacteriia bacterium]|nr:hypothetical protein [Flavobacteriia bacterium]
MVWQNQEMAESGIMPFSTSLDLARTRRMESLQPAPDDNVTLDESGNVISYLPPSTPNDAGILPSEVLQEIDVSGVRITPHIYTTIDELDKLVVALNEIAQ